MSVSIASLLEAGSNAFAQANYNEALDNFSRAIKSAPVGHADRSKLLDHRIGTLLKLKKFDEAFSDAKSIVREARTDGRGYLRCGQLETLKGNHHTASKWYAHGIKNVPPSARLYETLTVKLGKSRDIIQAELVKMNARDPLTMLPLEVIAMIIQHLEYRTVVILLRVSRPWKSVLSSISPLCDTIDLSAVSRPVGYHHLRAILRRLKQYPRKAVISSLNDSASRILPDHLERWLLKDCLEHLEVYGELCVFPLPSSGAPKLRYLTYHNAAAIPFDIVARILACCKQLRHAHFANVYSAIKHNQPPLFPSGFDQPALEHLEFYAEPSGWVAHLSDMMFVPFRNLQRLRCRGLIIDVSEQRQLDLSKYPLQHLQLQDCFLEALPKLPSTLLELDLSGTAFGNVAGDLNLPTVTLPTVARPMPLPHLQSLLLYETPFAGDSRIGLVYEDLLLKAKPYPCLQTLHLDLNWLHDTTLENVIHYFQHPSVKHLRFRAQDMKDEYAEEFVRRLPNLEMLRLERARVTGVFVAALLRRENSKLKYLCLEDCPDVSRDAIDFARNLGVTVEVNNRSDVWGGRRIG